MKDDLELQRVEMKCNVTVSSVCTCGGHVSVQKPYTNMAAAYIRLLSDYHIKQEAVDLECTLLFL